MKAYEHRRCRHGVKRGLLGEDFQSPETAPFIFPKPCDKIPMHTSPPSSVLTPTEASASCFTDAYIHLPALRPS